MKDKMSLVGNYILKHCKIVFPVILTAVVAFTVVFALGMRNGEEEEPQVISGEPVSQADAEESMPSAVSEEVPLLANDGGELYSLVATYYNAMALGDTETILSIYDDLPENSLLKIEETAKYINYYSTLEIYTKDGMTEDATVVYVFYRLIFQNHEEEFPGYETLYVCRNEQGQLYIKNEDNFTPEEKEYITTVTHQDDVVEFNNRVNTEYNDLITEKPELFRYLSELDNQISVAVGVRVAQNEAQAAVDAQPAENPEPPAAEGGENPEPPAETVPEAAGPQYATATTTVNVRSSDSEQADKLGKVAGGETVQVQEVRLNGWTKIVYDGKDGYIKSEFLQIQEGTAGAEVIGTVTASTNINVRASASETADRLGVLAGGESVELLENLDGWCKIKYSGQIGFVKSDYVEQ